MGTWKQSATATHNSLRAPVARSGDGTKCITERFGGACFFSDGLSVSKHASVSRHIWCGAIPPNFKALFACRIVLCGSYSRGGAIADPQNHGEPVTVLHPVHSDHGRVEIYCTDSIHQMSSVSRRISRARCIASKSTVNRVSTRIRN
jgi:hypothetical protein